MEFSNMIEKRIQEIEKETGKKILGVAETAKYLGTSEEDVKELISTKELKCIGSKIAIIRSYDIATLLCGDMEVSTATKNTGETPANSHLDNSLTSALSYLQSLAQDVNEEDFMMAVKEYGEGSVYWNKAKQCYQMAFYLEINGEKKRKIVSGKSENEVAEKAAVAKAIANGVVTQATPSAPLIIVQGVQEKLVVRKTVNGVVDEWLASIKTTAKPATYQWYSNLSKHVKEHLGFQVKKDNSGNEIKKENNISDLTFSDFQDCLNVVARPEGAVGKLMSQDTVNGVNLVLHNIVMFSKHNKYLLENPMEGIKLPKAKKTNRDSKFLNRNQIATILRTLKDNFKYTVLVTLLVYTGMRIGEALGLEWKDIDKISKKIHIRQALSQTGGDRKYDIGSTKTDGSVRDIPLDPKVEAILDQWKQYIESDSKLVEKIKANGKEDFVFVNDQGNLFNYQTLQNHFQEYMKRHGIGDLHCTFHMLRHTYGSLLLENKETRLIDVSRLLGHSSIQITADIYCTISDEAKEIASKRMGKIMEDIHALL
ncbi:tyrosine-type recombinase/integrase [Caproiciproducens sp.]|uniref:tyrosine-type recombinase/integrase n=1 Tax=Caproiciproducens sp. TaxID=1954376 RepID=UPI0028A18B00|nr:site-specific integrase [Caproiciproducens sp.]